MTAKQFSLILGSVFIVVAIAGFVTGGHDHELVIFGVNMTHNLVHLLSGLVAVIASFAGEKPAKMYCLIFGVVYGVVTIAGFLNIAQVVTMLNLNTADNFLHLAISAATLFIGVKSKA